jgi:hypothetical protein
MLYEGDSSADAWNGIDKFAFNTKNRPPNGGLFEY